MTIIKAASPRSPHPPHPTQMTLSHDIWYKFATSETTRILCDPGRVEFTLWQYLLYRWVSISGIQGDSFRSEVSFPEEQ